MDSSSYSVHNTDYSHTGSDSPHPPPLEPVIDSQTGKTSPDYMTLSSASASFTVIRPCCLFLSLPLLLRSLLLACSSPPSHRSRSLFLPFFSLAHLSRLLPSSYFYFFSIFLFLLCLETLPSVPFVFRVRAFPPLFPNPSRFRSLSGTTSEGGLSLNQPRRRPDLLSKKKSTRLRTYFSHLFVSLNARVVRVVQSSSSSLFSCCR